MFQIETNRLILRDFETSDILEYVELRKDEKFKRFYSESDVTDEKSIALVKLFVSQTKEQPRTIYQLAITTKNGKLIGSCGVRPTGEKQASFGCELGRKWQAHGYAYEAAKTLFDYAFKYLDIHRIYAETISENKAAIKLCMLLGMRIEANFIENSFFQDRWWDTTVMAILEHEWNDESA